jgi:hypothetical protein
MQLYNPDRGRPRGSNADQWAAFLAEHPLPEARAFLAVQIAEAIEQSERDALERAVDRMGWPEIHAFRAELHMGQGVREDAGGYFMRAIRALLGIRPRDPVLTYRTAARALIERAGR